MEGTVKKIAMQLLKCKKTTLIAGFLYMSVECLETAMRNKPLLC